MCGLWSGDPSPPTRCCTNTPSSPLLSGSWFGGPGGGVIVSTCGRRVGKATLAGEQSWMIAADGGGQKENWKTVWVGDGEDGGWWKGGERHRARSVGVQLVVHNVRVDSRSLQGFYLGTAAFAGWFSDQLACIRRCGIFSRCRLVFACQVATQCRRMRSSATPAMARVCQNGRSRIH